jgi:hypothetical protein
VTALANGDYVVSSPTWNGGPVGGLGAATWGDGTRGVTGPVSAANSLIGSDPRDDVGTGVTALTNGNYVVASPGWNNLRGAATWGDGTAGITGTVSAANRLVGSNPGDLVGDSAYPLLRDNGVTALSNGNYVVASPYWDGGLYMGRGAATWGDGARGVTGVVSAANSLVGSSPRDQVGWSGVTPLSDGNYVVQSPLWNGERGAATWGQGTAGVTGAVDAGNSLVGPAPLYSVSGGGVTELRNGNYVVVSAGAATWGDGAAGVTGVVSAANSLLGVYEGSPVLALSDGNYVVDNSLYDGYRGAATWVSGADGQTLDGAATITPQNSLLGQAPGAILHAVGENPVYHTFVASAPFAGGGRVTAGLADPNLLTFPLGQAQTLTVTPAFLTRTLDRGTAVVLQASNDLTVNSPVTVRAGGHGGALTLQAGRSIVLNAGITTDNGALTLVANDTLASGVVDDQRDPGPAVIGMAPGTALDTGSGPLTVELRDGAGLTNTASGAVTLRAVTAGALSVANDGPSAGSDVVVGPVATAGPQAYASPHGTTSVAGDLAAAGGPITFRDSVAVHDGLTVDAGAGTVDFAGAGLQTLHSGSGARFGNLVHGGAGTLRLTGGLAVTGTLTNAAGTFDAAGQPVTVTGDYVQTGGGTALRGGTLTAGGLLDLRGGTLSGPGTLDADVRNAATLSPGPGTATGVLTVTGDYT